MADQAIALQIAQLQKLAADPVMAAIEARKSVLAYWHTLDEEQPE